MHLAFARCFLIYEQEKEHRDSIRYKIKRKGMTNRMKKVTGYVSARPLGTFYFEFYVEDNATENDIQNEIDALCEVSQWYNVEEGYSKRNVEEYYKE